MLPHGEKFPRVGLALGDSSCGFPPCACWASSRSLLATKEQTRRASGEVQEPLAETHAVVEGGRLSYTVSNATPYRKTERRGMSRQTRGPASMPGPDSTFRFAAPPPAHEVFCLCSLIRPVRSSICRHPPMPSATWSRTSLRTRMSAGADDPADSHACAMSACTAERCVGQAYPSSGTSSIARLRIIAKRFALLKQ